MDPIRKTGGVSQGFFIRFLSFDEFLRVVILPALSSHRLMAHSKLIILTLLGLGTIALRSFVN